MVLAFIGSDFFDSSCFLVSEFFVVLAILRVIVRAFVRVMVRVFVRAAVH